MTHSADTADGSQVPDDELAGHAATYAAMLRAAAEHWRFLAQEGRVESRGMGCEYLVEMLESAAQVLEGERARRDGYLSRADGSTATALEQSEEMFRLLVDSVKDYAIYMLDPDGTIVSWNSGAERIKGYRAEEVIGRHFSLFYGREDIEAGKPAHELMAATKDGRYEEEGWRIRKDGTLIWVNFVITALRDSSGRLRGFAKVTRDFTERRRADESLRENEEKLRLMIEGVKDYAIFMLDPEGRIASWNEGARRIKGYEANEVIGQHFSIFYTPDDLAAAHPQHELEIATREGRYEEEGWRLRKDGSRFWATVLITAIRNPAGRLIGFAKLTRDLTDKRAAEESLRQSAADLERRVEDRTSQLQAANKEMEAFSYSVSHDLRAPLRGLDGFSKLLLASAREKLTAEEKDYLQRIRAAAQRMSQLIDDMLNFSRLARAPLANEPVDLSQTAEKVVADLRHGDPTRRVDVTIDPGLATRGDPRLLRIVLENLIGNAWKFTRQRPDARIEVGRSEDGGKPALFVRDNGAGFDMKYARKLFTPFQRLHSVREFEGTGIGLATASRIVQRHGGKISVQSTPGQGTTFTVTLEEVG